MLNSKGSTLYILNFHFKRDQDARMGFNEFKELWSVLSHWKVKIIFKQMQCSTCHFAYSTVIDLRSAYVTHFLLESLKCIRH